MAHDIAAKVIANITPISTGQEFEDAIVTAARYWDTVLTGKPDPEAKVVADRALSKLLGCKASVSGRKHAWKDKILSAFS